jgi:hypothetical protein
MATASMVSCCSASFTLLCTNSTAAHSRSEQSQEAVSWRATTRGRLANQ